QQHVPSCRDGIKKHPRTDVRGGLDADGDDWQNHAREQYEFVPGSKLPKLLALLVRHVAKSLKVCRRLYITK
ncbi:MAG TPA: hypothetical protein VJT69_04905, partial [Pyrinomonadaceae bacterium]|nr:hypothetical protein [Pyrinomonadaceae bacterium]